MGMRKHLIIGVLALGLAGLVALGLYLRPSEPVDASVLAQRAGERKEDIKADLRNGAILYMKLSQVRPGALCPDVVVPEEFCFPDAIVLELWQRQTGDPPVEIAVYNTREELLATIVFTGEDKITTDADTGKVRVHHYPELQSLNSWLDAAFNLINRLERKGFTQVGTGDLSGQGAVIFERRSTVGPDEYLTRLEVAVDNPLINRERRWKLDDTGQRVLDWETHVQEVDVLPPGSPTGPAQ